MVLDKIVCGEDFFIVPEWRPCDWLFAAAGGRLVWLAPVPSIARMRRMRYDNDKEVSEAT